MTEAPTAKGTPPLSIWANGFLGLMIALNLYGAWALGWRIEDLTRHSDPLWTYPITVLLPILLAASLVYAVAAGLLIALRRRVAFYVLVVVQVIGSSIGIILQAAPIGIVMGFLNPVLIWFLIAPRWPDMR